MQMKKMTADPKKTVGAYNSIASNRALSSKFVNLEASIEAKNDIINHLEVFDIQQRH